MIDYLLYKTCMQGTVYMHILYHWGIAWLMRRLSSCSLQIGDDEMMKKHGIKDSILYSKVCSIDGTVMHYDYLGLLATVDEKGLGWYGGGVISYPAGELAR